MSITFDGTQIQDSTHIPRFIKHETAPDRLPVSIPLARENGQILIAELYGTKVIALQGTLIGSSQADLDGKIDTFKELFSRPEKNLDIDYNGGTRRYVATCTKMTFDRDHYHTNAVPWTAEFTVFTGQGIDTSATTALNAHAVTITTPGTDSFTMNGSTPAKPYIVIQGNSFAGGNAHAGIEYKNTDTNERCVFTHQTGAMNAGDYVIFDCANKKVYYSTDNITLTESKFAGTFPHFKIGTNNVKITAGAIINQADSGGAITAGNAIQATTQRHAQSFTVPYTDATFSAISVALSKEGSPTGGITIRIETDAAGIPSGTLVDANATVTIPAGSIPNGRAYRTANFGGLFSLTANTQYWIVLKITISGSGADDYDTCQVVSGYPNGQIKVSTDSGATYAVAFPGSSLAFQLFYGGTSGTGAVKHTVTYTAAYL